MKPKNPIPKEIEAEIKLNQKSKPNEEGFDSELYSNIRQIILKKLQNLGHSEQESEKIYDDIEAYLKPLIRPKES